MARKPSPWYWPERNGWFTILDGKRRSLGDHPAEAAPPQKRKGRWIPPAAIEQVFHALLASPTISTVPAPSDLQNASLSVAEVFEKYLDWCKKHRSPRSFEWYKKHIQSFIDFLPDQGARPASSLRPFHIVEWVDKHTTWGANHRRGAMVATTRPSTGRPNSDTSRIARSEASKSPRPRSGKAN